MKKVYLDNASTTAIRPEVIQEMTKVLTEDYGNPSSTHSLGRSAKNVLELSRKSIAKNLNATAQEIIFTSCGTEANNWILRSAVKDLKVQRIITSKIEHHAVLYTALVLEKEYGIQIDYVAIKPNGAIDITDLVELLSQDKKTLVSLMHVNNEIGTVLDLERISRICQEHSALFHSDTVQSIGKTGIDLQNLSIDFIVASAHKFHGPKGVGFAFIRKNSGMQPLFFGGEQEKGLRAGTEALHQIAGMAKALELSYTNLETERKHISEVRSYLITKLEIDFPGFEINGNSDGFYTVLNVLLPFSDEKTAMILFHLDMKGIAVSRGSACQSGSIKPSHVLAEMLSNDDLKKPSLRISFSHYNTKEDIDLLIAALKTI
ncbi:cysteine desulfurase [Flavobacterium sp. GSP27]|uniref:cysteine desulfurase family protein n=1 Tax=unclassified Flavobacterium TaxID=196869 RepID=UPI000F82303D|nr:MULTISPECIES: cysteine desulfurase family protein [unclassified Flavobacterium]RTY94688.1 cysteine desulfurase [Flavobacterium sp. GSN2]RTY73376.1 cysteine desulfurase [Flavobacterium sp. LS1R10]RTY81483.1 cysteine desulfurase [Flavobacterium sp. ZB4P23]RTY91402.1 cysteine desulfurase [Flavobacterium sp. RSP46]RTY99732.1 cysteine desulfurase [Flavobacterium sp. RSP49]